jgi:hypothetical protein
LRLLGAQLGRIPLGRKEDDGRVARGHRTDDEAFSLPCVLLLESVEAFLGAGLGWLDDYTYERVHSGYGMACRTPYGCCVALGFSGSGYVGLMSVVLLGDMVLEWSRQGLPAVNDVLTHYRRSSNQQELLGARRSLIARDTSLSEVCVCER